MKPWLLFLVMSATMAKVGAAPAKKAARVQWEYAVLQLDYYRPHVAHPDAGALLCLPGQKSLFLSSEKPRSAEYKAYLFNRLGSQGWELVTATGIDGNENCFTFKRQK